MLLQSYHCACFGAYCCCRKEWIHGSLFLMARAIQALPMTSTITCSGSILEIGPNLLYAMPLYDPQILRRQVDSTWFIAQRRLWHVEG